MTELYGNAWTSQFGEAGEGAWQTWCKGLAKLSMTEIADGVNQVIEKKPKFPPNLPEFIDICGGSVEKRLGLPGMDLAFPRVMNVATRMPEFGKEKDLSELSPALYWIYQNIDLYLWTKMNTSEARRVFNSVYKACLEAAANGEEFPDPPVLIESPEVVRQRERESDPAYKSKRRAAARKALSEIRKVLA